jgi:hypothetical protein
MKTLIFFILIQFVINKRIHPSDYCIDSNGCSREYHYKCWNNLCSKARLGCQGLKLWTFFKNSLEIKNFDIEHGIYFRSVSQYLFSN